MNSYTLFLVDPNDLRAAAYAAFLQPWAQRSRVGLHVARDPDQLAELPKVGPTLCLYAIGGASLRHPGIGHTLARLRAVAPDSALIVLSDTADNDQIAAALCHGLQGLVPTTMSPHVAIAAIQFIIDGGTYLPPAEAADPPQLRLTGQIRRISDHRPGASPCPPLTLAAAPRWSGAASVGEGADALTKRRHIQVAGFLAKGETNKEIARHLQLTEATIKVYVRELMKHFSAKNRIQVALRASALIQPPTAMAEEERAAPRPVAPP